MVAEKRKTISKTSTGGKTSTNKKNKVEPTKQEQQNNIMSMGYDDDEDVQDYSGDEDDKAIQYNDKHYNGGEEEESEEDIDFLEGIGSDDEQLDDSEAVVGRPTILPEKSELEEKEFINLKVKNISFLKQSVAPTNDEIQHLRETQDLFNSNLFRLQIVELFKEIKIDYGKLSALESSLHQIKSLIEKIPSQEIGIEQENIEAIKIFDFQGGEGLSLNYTRPHSIEVAGSFMTRSILKSTSSIPNVDLTIEIPSSVFDSKDANDYKYFNKRNLYLLKIYNTLAATTRFSDISFKNFNNDSNKQILVVRPKEDPKTGARTKFQIRIIPTISKDLFKIYSKFHPNIGCIFLADQQAAPADGTTTTTTTTNTKIETFKEEDSKDNTITKAISRKAQSAEEANKLKNKKPFDQVKRTPFYNNSILEDIFIGDHMQLINEKCENAPVLVDTMLLIKLWLGLKKIPSVNSFQLSMLLVHLYTSGKISKSMSSYQAFRMLMVFISKDFSKRPLAFMKLSTEATNSIKQGHYHEEFEKLYPVALIDDSGLLNLWSSVSVWGFKQLVIEASLVIENLDSGNGFEEIFMTKFHFYQEYDMIVKIVIGHDQYEQLAMPTNDYYQKESYLDYRIYQLLKKSLTKRVTKICILGKEQSEPMWKKQLPLDDKSVERTITVGLKVNPDHWLSVIDLGPPADHVNAGKFREFWGNKSQIRRFKDGSILEAVTWTPKNGSRHLVIEEIVRFTLGHHLKLPGQSVSSVISELDALVITQHVQDHTLEIIASKQKLISTIQSLGLPLGIEAYPPISPALRYTSVLTTKDYSYLENTPIELLLLFETSQQWTKDVHSINALKQAFLLKIARELENTHFNPKLTEHYVDLQLDGFVFRCIAFYPKEMEFMRDQWITEGLPALEQLSRNSMHHTLIQSLHTTHSSYGPTTRIALRWIHSHLFSDFIDQNTVELLVASLYKTTENEDGSLDAKLIPKTPIMGFLRFLFLLYTFNFQEKPLIVDYQNTLDSGAINAIKNTFELQKKSNNPPLIFIATDKDRSNQWFRSSTISNVEQFDKIKLLAQRSIELIESNYSSKSFNWLSIFEPSYIEFDAIFTLNEKLIPNHSKEITNLINNKNFNLINESQKQQDIIKPVTKSTTSTTSTNNSTAATNKKPVFKNLIKKQPTVNPNILNVEPSTEQQQTNNNNNNNNNTLFDLQSNFQPGFNPVTSFVEELKSRFSDYFTIQYDLVGGTKLALKWNSNAFLPQPFKPSKSKYSIAISKDSNLVIPNIFEILNEIQMLGGKLIKNFKLNQNSNTIINEFN